MDLFGLSWEWNDDCYAMIDDVLLGSPFHEKGEVCGMLAFFLFCGEFGSIGIERFLTRWSNFSDKV